MALNVSSAWLATISTTMLATLHVQKTPSAVLRLRCASTAHPIAEHAQISKTAPVALILLASSTALVLKNAL